MIEEIPSEAPLTIFNLDNSGAWLDSSGSAPSVYNPNSQTFAQLYPDSNLEFYKNVELSEVPGSNSRVWYKLDSSSNNIVEDTINFKFDDINSSYLMRVKYWNGAAYINNPINSYPLFWVLDNQSGYLELYQSTTNLSSFANIPTNPPKLSFLKYVGKKGLLNLDISGQQQVGDISGLDTDVSNILINLNNLNRMILPDGYVDISGTDYDLCGNEAVRTYYNYVRSKEFVGFETLPVLDGSAVDHTFDISAHSRYYNLGVSGDSLMVGKFTQGYYIVGPPSAPGAGGWFRGASGEWSHAEGDRSYAGGDYSHAEGSLTKTESTATFAHAEGSGSIADAVGCHVEGQNTTVKASSTFAHAEGFKTVIDSNSSHSHSEGYSNTIASKGVYAHAEGSGNIILGNSTYNYSGSHVEGAGNTIDGALLSHAEGYQNTIHRDISFAHSEGKGNHIWADGGHTEGSGNTIDENAFYSHVEGLDCSATAAFSHAEGKGTIIDTEGGHSSGFYNDNSKNVIMVVGCGSDNNNRADAFYIDTSCITHVNEKLDISGDLIVSGHTQLQDVSCSNLDVSNNLNVYGDTQLQDVSCSNLDVSNNLNVYGDTQLQDVSCSNLDVSNNLNVYGDTQLQDVSCSNLEVSGNITLWQDMSMNGGQITFIGNATDPSGVPSWGQVETAINDLSGSITSSYWTQDRNRYTL